MTDPRTFVAEAKVILTARNRDRTHYEDCWRGHPDCLASHLADALIAALDDVEEQRNNAEGFWEDRERFREQNERLRAQMDAAINLLNAEVSRLRHEYGVALQVLLDHGVTPGELEQALTETPEREG